MPAVIGGSRSAQPWLQIVEPLGTIIEIAADTGGEFGSFANDSLPCLKAGMPDILYAINCPCCVPNSNTVLAQFLAADISR